MNLDHRISFVVAIAVSAIACTDGTIVDAASDGGTASMADAAAMGPDADGSEAGADAGIATDAAPVGPPSVSSLARANLKTKSGERFLADLADSLDLPRADVCRELGAIDCIEVHGISMLEVEPRFLRIQTPIEGLITGVIASDRIALHACANRVDADLTGAESPALVPELSSGLDNAMDRAAVVDRLARRLIRRPATDEERAQLSEAYEALANDDRDRVWVTLTCFALATLTENLFY